jgi:hypothetical protein
LQLKTADVLGVVVESGEKDEIKLKSGQTKVRKQI